MNKAELIADIESRVITTIGAPQLKTDVDGVKVYIQTVLSPEGINKANERNIAFIVVNEGGAGEAAYYRDTSHLERDDRQKATTYMQNLVANDTIEGYQIEQLQAELSDASYSIAKVWVDDGAGKLAEKRFHISRNAQGGLTHKEIV